ncbi:phosphoribosylanthranilate isomerase [Desulfogranum mediterraneum]|uniref:phosphoribosylanthranilate isomerase n=1 Tax=Desulfogranum mediterraneum TaxID=160661 RepID=UPI000421A151|nr:phosphoribosylanthranilate isomerase [Desulfogranum mediterraneum]
MKRHRRTRIKICGITRLDDALEAVEEGVDALGFIFYEGSPRFIDPEEAKLIIEQLPPFVGTVGVFVDKKRKEVEEIVEYCCLDYVQLHGSESPKYCERLARHAAPCQVLKALRVGPELSAETVAVYSPHVKGFVLDTYSPLAVGGTGTAFDWNLIEKLELQKPFLLAGGLSPDNVESALTTVRPYGVDANSGLETEPGVKDHGLIRSFIRKVRELENSALLAD